MSISPITMSVAERNSRNARWRRRYPTMEAWLLGHPEWPDRLDPENWRTPKQPSRLEAIKRVKKQMAKLGVTLADLADISTANGNAARAPKANGNTRWQRINGNWFQVPKPKGA